MIYMLIAFADVPFKILAHLTYIYIVTLKASIYKTVYKFWH